ncbi:hypothetical protein MUG87_17720 [Ectobacillus sp. JY-23]|uniref:hypothetical protein n=1 Tax=Ectobacillus sp. JY-23 TaxID=2933872 RepID=UPI001FF5142D|nr:hypothetical protein [Ectobacillus sp. JY-23]UOY92247.1 hypothetical protein MUG87_17720 [Ectobacillus sp. JY-23]
MPFRYICPHCQGSGTQYKLRLLSFMTCKVCKGEGHVVVSINEPVQSVPVKTEEEVNEE